MITAELLTVFAVTCLATSAFLAREHLQERRGLRVIFIGLFLGAAAGVAISWSGSLATARVLSVVMLAGVAVIVRGIYLEQGESG